MLPGRPPVSFSFRTISSALTQPFCHRHPRQHTKGASIVRRKKRGEALLSARPALHIDCCPHTAIATPGNTPRDCLDRADRASNTVARPFYLRSPLSALPLPGWHDFSFMDIPQYVYLTYAVRKSKVGARGLSGLSSWYAERSRQRQLCKDPSLIRATTTNEQRNEEPADPRPGDDRLRSSTGRPAAA